MTYELVPPNEDQIEFVKSAIGLLKNNKKCIATKSIPLGWGLEIAKEAALCGYSITIGLLPVNFGETGTAHAIFNFERTNSK